MSETLTLAISGGTGFVGAHLIDLALSAGHKVRALTRRDQPRRKGVSWIAGDLADANALARLCKGADAVIHVAGVINAPDAEGFEQGNVLGTGAILSAAEKAGVTRFVHVSSLAAREPARSLYGASKARSEALLSASPIDCVVVRPPAVYGPGDKETLELFKMAKRGAVLLPPKGRLSIIHVDDLCALLLALAKGGPSTTIIEPDDGRAGGWSHEEFAQALGRAVGRERVTTLSVPAFLLSLAARGDRLLRGAKAKLTPDRAAYFSHPDWVARKARMPAKRLWKPRIATEDGLASTAKWYQDQHWL